MVLSFGDNVPWKEMLTVYIFFASKLSGRDEVDFYLPKPGMCSHFSFMTEYRIVNVFVSRNFHISTTLNHQSWSVLVIMTDKN